MSLSIFIKKYSYQSKSTLVLLLLIIFMLTAVSPLSAAPANSVGLINFDAIPQTEGVALQWTTASELDTAGFRIQRVSENSTVDLTGIIVAEGNPTLGATYQFVDETAVSNILYTYFLIEVELSAAEQTVASVEVMVNLQPTNVPIAPLPTINQPPEPTIFAEPTSLATAVPTNTPAPTNIPVTETHIPETAVPPTETSSDPIAIAAVQSIETDTVDAVTQPEREPIVREPIIREPIANVQAQSTPSDGYPAPATVNPTPTIEGYPVNPPPEITNNSDPTPYPPPLPTENGSFVSTPQNLTTIGEDPVDEGLRDLSAPETAEPINENAARGRLFLWLGFILAGLIFGIAVVGSMLFFVRRK